LIELIGVISIKQHPIYSINLFNFIIFPGTIDYMLCS